MQLEPITGLERNRLHRAHFRRVDPRTCWQPGQRATGIEIDDEIRTGLHVASDIENDFRMVFREVDDRDISSLECPTHGFELRCVRMLLLEKLPFPALALPPHPDRNA